MASLVISHHRQKDKLSVFLNGTQGEVMAPAIVALQMLKKADRMPGVVQWIIKKALIKLSLITFHRRIWRGSIDSFSVAFRLSILARSKEMETTVRALIEALWRYTGSCYVAPAAIVC